MTGGKSSFEIKELRALRGPNRYTKYPAIFMVLNIHEYEELPSDKIPGFTERLVALLPSLQEHGCSIGEAGGFIQRLNRGTWMGHIIEHVAIELQCLSGMEVSYGKTFSTSQDSVYLVVFRYLVESVGLKAAKEAIALVEAVANGQSFDIQKTLAELMELREDDRLGTSTMSIVEEAESRKIPCLRLNHDNYVQLGYGAQQKRIQATMTCNTSAIAVEIADEKTRTKDLLKSVGIPVPLGIVTSIEKEALDFFDQQQAALVVKPEVGNHGRAVSINIRDKVKLLEAFKEAQGLHDEVIIEEFIEGKDFRLLVIDGKFVAAAQREPAHVIGDGKSTIAELINEVNLDPRRGFGHENILTNLDLDESTKRFLAKDGLSLDSKLKQGEKIYLKSTANLSQGGTATNLTDTVSPSIRLIAERIVKTIGLDCCGIDVIAHDLSLPLKESGLKVIEVNAAPGLRMHLEPTLGQKQNVAKPIVDMLFPDGYTPVPVIAVTGTNGKTTTCKLIAHSLKYSGKIVGLASTTGVEIDGNAILDGDYSGPSGARIVLSDSNVDHAVIEAARGGIVRRGLGVKELNIGVLLNIGHDHLGRDWIETQEDLSLVKSTVIETVCEGGHSILNADDPVVMSLIARASGTIILFSLDPNNSALKKHLDNGGIVITQADEQLLIRTKDLDIIVCRIDEIPITVGGIVDFNISNVMAAVGALYGLGLSIEQIRNGIKTFYPSVNQNPGRLNIFDFDRFKLIVDFGHNSDSARAFAQLLSKFKNNRKVGLCHGSGSRTDEQIIDYGRTLATVYDHIILSEFDPRNRPLLETTELVKKGLLLSGFDPANIECVAEPTKAIDHLFSIAQDNDLMVLQIDELEPTLSQIVTRHKRDRASL